MAKELTSGHTASEKQSQEPPRARAPWPALLLHLSCCALPPAVALGISAPPDFFSGRFWAALDQGDLLEIMSKAQ